MSLREKVNRPVVLGYHAVSSAWRAQLAVSETQLRTQIAYLHERGYVGLTISEAERLRNEGTLPPRSVVVTFDDGYASTMRAVPILEEFGFPGTVFVVTSFVESGEPLSWRGIEQWSRPETIGELTPLTWRDAKDLVDRGWEVGSHTVTHPVLTRASDEVLLDELLHSRTEIKRQLGRCSAVAYPYGVADARVADAARGAGYEVGCMLTFAHYVDEPFRRPRIGMGPSQSRIRLRVELSRVGQAALRSQAARLARAAHRRREWLPDP